MYEINSELLLSYHPPRYIEASVLLMMTEALMIDSDSRQRIVLSSLLHIGSSGSSSNCFRNRGDAEPSFT